MVAVRVVLGILWLGTCFVPFAMTLVFLLPFRRARIRVSGVLGRYLAAGFLRVTGMRVVVDDALTEASPAVYVCNHTSLLDGIFLAYAAPPGTCYVARRGILFFPFIGQLYWLAGHLLINRGRTDRAIASLRSVAAYVRRHRLGLWIWPEGTRSDDGRLAPAFKKGFVHMAVQTGLPVQPLIAIGAHRAWPKGTLNLQPVEMHIRFLPRIDTGSWRPETAAEHAEEVRRAMLAALPQDQKTAEAVSTSSPV
jgi:lysophosphatidate acyltransferase